MLDAKSYNESIEANKNKYVLDRIEGNMAVLVSDNTCKPINIDVNDIAISLSDFLKEGDIIIFKDGQYSKDKVETKQRKEHIKVVFDSLKKSH